MARCTQGAQVLNRKGKMGMGAAREDVVDGCLALFAKHPLA
jgi:hypothetical protein